MFPLSWLRVSEDGVWLADSMDGLSCFGAWCVQWAMTGPESSFGKYLFSELTLCSTGLECAHPLTRSDTQAFSSDPWLYQVLGVYADSAGYSPSSSWTAGEVPVLLWPAYSVAMALMRL